MSLSDHVRTLGRGPGRARSLSRAEAEDAMAQMLSGNAAPEAIGALLMLLRMKGETPDEIAGFAATAQATHATMPAADLDWPSYAAGRTRGAPWFLLSARLVARAGHTVLLHGWNGRNTAVRAHLAACGIPAAEDAAAIERALSDTRLAYAPIEALNPALFRLLGLRDTLGLRSCINTVARMLNPGRAGAVVQGVFHPAYRELQTQAAHKLGWTALTVIKGGGGEMERHPGKDIITQGLRDGALWSTTFPATTRRHARLSDIAGTSDLAAVWSGEFQCPVATGIVIGTAAVALDTLGHEQADLLAEELWESRSTALAAQPLAIDAWVHGKGLSGRGRNPGQTRP